MTFSGALLAAAFALSKSAADVGLVGSAKSLFAIEFVATITLLVAVVLLCVMAVRPVAGCREPIARYNRTMHRDWGLFAIG